MAAGLIAALAPLAAQILPSLLGGKGGEMMKPFGDMAKGTMSPFGALGGALGGLASKFIGRGMGWLEKKIFGTSGEEEENINKINEAKAQARALGEIQAEEEKRPRPRKRRGRRLKEEPPLQKKIKAQPMELEGTELNQMFNEEQIPETNPNYAPGGKYEYEKP